jgi:hypothetical protein
MLQYYRMRKFLQLKTIAVMRSPLHCQSQQREILVETRIVPLSKSL